MRGVKNLRVINANMIFVLIGGHPQIAIYAIAEKAADITSSTINNVKPSKRKARPVLNACEERFHRRVYVRRDKRVAQADTRTILPRRHQCQIRWAATGTYNRFVEMLRYSQGEWSSLEYNNQDVEQQQCKEYHTCRTVNAAIGT